jgi:hypothetical protein
VPADGFTRPAFSGDRRRLSTRRASRSLGRRHRRRQQHAGSSSCCCIVRGVVVAVGVADRFVHVYNDRFVCGANLNDSVVAAIVLPDAPTTCLHCRLSAGRDGQSIDRHLPPIPAQCPPAPVPVPVPVPVPCVEDVDFLIMASCNCRPLRPLPG